MLLGEWIIGAGVVGTVYGVLNRLLIPIGLHHILNSFIWFVFGEYTTPAGVVATGDLNRFFAGDPNAGMFMGGFYIMMMFGMPAVALAMYRAAKPENRSKVGGALASVAFTAFLTGITETNRVYVHVPGTGTVCRPCSTYWYCARRYPIRSAFCTASDSQPVSSIAS